MRLVINYLMMMTERMMMMRMTVVMIAAGAESTTRVEVIHSVDLSTPSCCSFFSLIQTEADSGSELTYGSVSDELQVRVGSAVRGAGKVRIS